MAMTNTPSPGKEVATASVAEVIKAAPSPTPRPIPLDGTHPTAKMPLPTSDETTVELKRRLAKELYRAELDMAAGLKIADKPCDCLTGDSLVYVAGDTNSVLPIKDIYKRKTQMVTTHKGPGKITEHMVRDYSNNICEFKFGYMSLPLCASPEHPFLIAKDGWKWNWRNHYGGLNETRLDWVDAGDITTNDFISFPRYTKTIDMDIVTPELAELFGWYLAEGSKTDHRITLSLGHHEKESLTRLVNIFYSTFGKKPKVYVKTTTATLNFADQEFTALFDAFGRGAANKQLPEWCLYLPFNKQGRLLRGLFTGDGCLTNGGMNYATISQNLAYQIRFMLFRLGIIHGLSMHKDQSDSHIGDRVIHNNDPVYHIRINGDALYRLSELADVPKWHHVGLRKPRNNGWVGESTIFLPIRSVAQVPYEGKLYNMSVLGDESYLTPYGAVHNCLSNKHTLMLEAAAEELVSQDPGNPVYQEIIQWIPENRAKVTPEAIASGKYTAEYPHMANEFKNFRKRVMGSVGAPQEPVPTKLTKEQAKKMAADAAAAEIERVWKEQ